MGRKIQQWIQKEQGRRITELHRNLLRNHGPSRSRVPTWLFTSGDHHQATVPTFSNVLSTQEVIPLPVDRHADVLREEDARRCWIDQMLALLK